MRFRYALPVLLAAAATPAAAQDGGALFKQRCSTCHSVEAGKPAMLAPNLAGVVGRPAASTSFGTYSAALKASKLTWDKPTLDKFLSAPMKLVPGTRMVISVPDPAQRAAVIAYLATTKK